MNDKIYYSIGEVAEMFQVNASLIRYWETEFSSLRPRKNKKGNRLFTQKDIQALKEIYTLVKTKGYTLQGAKDVLRARKKEQENEANTQEVLKSLKQIRFSLLEIKENLPQDL
ncbi:MAG: MerR family transcriptional regulator [Bacteroidales bacterium]